MAKKCNCEKPFNPWPSFVDMFSSVILVLLFFILFIIVLLAYYLQFNSVTKISKIINDEIKTNTINVKTETVHEKVVMIKVQELPKLKKKIIIKDGEADGAATPNELKTDYVGMNLKVAKKTKLKEKYILSKEPNHFTLPFSETNKIVTNTQYNLMKKEFKLRKDFEKVIITSYLPNNNYLNIVQKNQLSLVRTISIKNFIKNEQISLDKVEFKFKKRNLNKEYKKIEQDGFFLFEFE